jgi:SAM-dependent methyltransferase
MGTVGENRVSRVSQLVCDVSGERLRSARVLDLGCNDGGFSLELARRGAREVIGIEGREANLVRGRATREAEGLTQVDFRIADVRTLSREAHGEFDIVLCLGLLYHLDVPDLFEFVRRLAEVCRGYALIETNVGLKPRKKVTWDGQSYHGLWYGEDTSRPGASLDNPRSFWPTKPSLLNLLGDVGFTTVSEVAYPFVPTLAEFRDHTLLLAVKGAPHDRNGRDRWPERLPVQASPRQSVGYFLRDRAARLRGGGFPSVFR